jgi:MFS family permease
LDDSTLPVGLLRILLCKYCTITPFKSLLSTSVAYIPKIDKTTLSYAAIFNIRQDLNLVGTEYSWLSSIFYFGFLAWAFPTNFLLQRFPIGKYLGVNIFMWGFFLMLQACARNFAELAALRALSGAAEACADPAFMLITSMW